MSSKLSFDLEDGLEDPFEEFMDAEDIGTKKEAIHDLMRRGLADWNGSKRRHRLRKVSVKVGDIGAIAAILALLLSIRYGVAVDLFITSAIFAVGSLLGYSVVIYDYFKGNRPVADVQEADSA